MHPTKHPMYSGAGGHHPWGKKPTSSYPPPPQNWVTTTGWSGVNQAAALEFTLARPAWVHLGDIHFTHLSYISQCCNGLNWPKEL